MFGKSKKKEKKEQKFDIFFEEKIYQILGKGGKFLLISFALNLFVTSFLLYDIFLFEATFFFTIVVIVIRILWEFVISLFRLRLKNLLTYQVVTRYQSEYRQLYHDLVFLCGTIIILFFIVIIDIISSNLYLESGKNYLACLVIYFATIICLRIYIYSMKNTLGKVMLNELVKKRVKGDIQKVKIPDPIFQQTAELVDKLYESVADTMQEKVNAEKMKTELITNVTHDIKTPLTSIINYINLLKNETDPEEKNRYLNVLDYNSKRLKSLILDLIYASKTGSGNIDLNMELIELNELILQVYGQFDRSFQEKNLEFVFNNKRNNIYMLTDGAQLSRVIENILSNCAKYSMENTRVYGMAEYAYGKIKIEFKNLSKEKLNISEKVLINQFTRGDKSRHEEGSGLGLYITKNLVEMLGGEFEIKINGDLFISTIEFSVRIKEEQ